MQIPARLAMIGRRARWFHIILVALASALILAGLFAPEVARNLIMLAYLRSWTRDGDASLNNLNSLSVWLYEHERVNPQLQAQQAALAQMRGDQAAALAALERARESNSISGHCTSQDAMLLEQMAHPFIPTQQIPRTLVFSTYSAQADAASQHRITSVREGVANGECLSMLTTAIPAGSKTFAEMQAQIPVQINHHYRIELECYMDGALDATFGFSDEPEPKVTLDAKDAWTTIRLNFQAGARHLMRAQIRIQAGIGRIVCRNGKVYETANDKS